MKIKQATNNFNFDLIGLFTPRITSWIIRQESEDEERNKENHYCVNEEFESKHYDTISNIIFGNIKRIYSSYITYPIFWTSKKE